MRLLVQAGTITALAVAIVACGGSSQAAEPANPTSQSQGESPSSSVAPEDIIVSQYANITRTFPTFDYMAEYSRRIAERTNGRVEIQMTSFAELGLAGPDTLRLIGDGTLEFGEVYSGYVGGDLVQSLGGEGQFIPFAEVYAALERGILDACRHRGSGRQRTALVRSYRLPGRSHHLPGQHLGCHQPGTLGHPAPGHSANFS